MDTSSKIIKIANSKKKEPLRMRKENTYFTHEKEEFSTNTEDENYGYSRKKSLQRSPLTHQAPAYKESTTQDNLQAAKQCIKCKGDHELFICPIFRKMKAEERTKYALTM